MISALWTGATGMQAQQTNVDVIANNLANVNTNGFKGSRVDFQDLLYTMVQAPGTGEAGGTVIPTGTQLGHGVKVSAIYKSFSQGDFVNTENPLDLVIEGDGFFQITMPDGTTAYTRDGSFKLDKDGNIVTSDGLALEPSISIPQDAERVTIAMDGAVQVLLPGQTTYQTVGNIELARFVNPAGLKAIGRNLFVETEASGSAMTGTPGEDNFGAIREGFLESSNVKVVDEMVNMIVAQRAYEMNSKAVQTSDEMLQIANSVKR